MADSLIGKELVNLTGGSTEIEKPDSVIGKILYKKLGHDVDYEDPNSIIGKLIEKLEVGGEGAKYEEILLYENPAPTESMSAGSRLVEFNNRSDNRLRLFSVGSLVWNRRRIV